MVIVDSSLKKLDIFRYILKECIKGEKCKFSSFQKTIDQIFFETKHLINKEKSLFQINSDYYNLIIYLSKKYPEYFQNISKPDRKFYKNMLKWMSDSNVVFAFDDNFAKQYC